MIGKRVINRFYFVVILFIISGTIYGQQNGKITGLVVDGELGDGLIGVNVIIKGTGRGAATDLDGKFFISNLPTGEYTLEVSMVGYAKQIIKNVIVNNEESTHLEIILQPESFKTDEVVIEARAVTNTEASMLAKRQRAAEVSDAVSSEQFEKLGGSNAADAVKQIVGATVVSGKEVVIRGLGDRYTSTSLNGTQIPSSDPYKRSGSIDIIPLNLIDNIKAVKSFTPDKPGDFSGGAVDINTKDYPDKFNFSFSAGAKYNDELTYNGNGLSYNGSSTDWLGFDNGKRALPSTIGNEPWVADVGAAQRNDETAKQIDDVTKSFNPEMTPFRSAAPLNQSYAISFGNIYEIFGNEAGLIASILYKNQHSGYIGGQLNRWDRGVADPNKTQLDTNFAMTDTRSISEATMGGLFKVSTKFRSNNSISFTYMYNQNGESVARFVSGKYPYDIDANWNYQARTLLYKERNLQSYRLEGNHNLTVLKGLEVSWRATSMETSQNTPDNRFFYNYETDNGVYGVKTNLPPERYFRKTNESANRFELDFIYPVSIFSGKNSLLKFGGAFSKTGRAFNERRFVYNPVTSVGKFLRDAEGNVNKLFSDENLGWTSTDTLGSGMTLNRFGLYINETDQTSSNYTGNRNISAYYGMIDLPISRTVRIIAGARFETTYMNVTSAKETIDEAVINTSDILPSVNVIYSPYSNMNFRISYGKTLARPSFREISPFQNYEFNGGDTYIGNPSLQRTLIDNLDLRWEWFPNPGEVFSVSLFGKRFKNPVELKIVDAPNKVLSWTNVDEANVYGLEFEIRKNIDFLSNHQNSFRVGSNLSLIYSRVDIDPEELANIRVYEPKTSASRQFQGQSPYVVNLYLDYENKNMDLTTSVYYNVFGKRLYSVGSLGAPNVYEKPVNLLNMSVTKSLISNLMIKVKIENLLNASNTKVQEFNGNEYVYSSYLRGRKISFGLTFKI